MSQRAFVILVHYGDPKVTHGCLESIADQEGSTYPVVVVDHGPGVPFETTLPAGYRGLNLTFIRQDNLGFGMGCNAGAEAAFAKGADWVWFLNPDARLRAAVLSRLLTFAVAHPEVGLWGTLQRDGDRLHGVDSLPSWFPLPACSTSALILPPTVKQLKARETLSGASILLSKEAWNRIGPWPDWCFLYWEDTALCLKAHQAGIPMAMTDLEIEHCRNTITGHHSPATTYYGVRNVLLLHADLWPGRRSERFRQAIHLLQKRFFQGRWRMLAPTLRGIRDARKNVRFKAS